MLCSAYLAKGLHCSTCSLEPLQASVCRACLFGSDVTLSVLSALAVKLILELHGVRLRFLLFLFLHSAQPFCHDLQFFLAELPMLHLQDEVLSVPRLLSLTLTLSLSVPLSLSLTLRQSCKPGLLS